MKIVRQGDILLIKRDALPDGKQTVIKRDKRRVVVAYGEVTGHAHAIAQSGVKQVEIDNIRWLIAPDDFVITHDEHAPLTLEAGVWEVCYQAEYTPQEIRRVMD